MLKGIKRVYERGEVNYSIVSVDEKNIPELNQAENVPWKDEYVDIEETIQTQYNGCAWLTNTVDIG